MISVNQLRKRKSDFRVATWILDSGAFTEISRFGGYRYGVEGYYYQICRWAKCGNLLRAVVQDYMCEPFILKKTGLTVKEHQFLTIDRYDLLFSYKPPVPIIPVLQGHQASDYLYHLQQYRNRLSYDEWVGIGSVCRRNGNTREIKDILRAIKLLRPDLRLHGFGLKQLALEDPEIQSLLYSCDSMAWSFSRKFGNSTSEIELAHNYQETIYQVLTDSVQKRTPVTAGAGNGQGRKSKWQGKTKAIRVPERFADKLLEIAREWDNASFRTPESSP